MTEADYLNDYPNILLLEDDLLLAMDMEDHLLQTGHNIIGPFGRIADAMDAIPRNDLAGAIVDLNLHGELSVPVIEMLRERDVPVIICSSHAELPELKSRLKDLPMLPKPWHPQKLNRLVAETFGASSTA
ncbi:MULTISPECIES: response regulator [Rhizobium]|jgi:two-component SAPR family response regulator|uniref:Two-component SAPR family response regulator n=1 Tax=Rhizobium wenxiniae TaxID=1737357 RepID=A0A7W9Y2R8_9HYPH|nr:response regulator [Rhizobium wenxiniae]MBB6160934.1 two-component SAPR family response regulator [Rhizobium wenxiniae]GGF85164.1 response regulator [Rhizobium wenxiniae]